jgi:large-conductance mechanosensitive channel
MDKNYQFVTKKNITNLAMCATIVAGFTEISKEICDSFHTQLIALLFSIAVSFGRLVFIDKKPTKEDWMLAVYNIVPIFFASTGIYEVGIKNLAGLFSGGANG